MSDETYNTLLNWVFGAIGALGLAAAGAIRHLHLANESANKKRIEVLEQEQVLAKAASAECLEHRASLQAECASLKTELTYVKGDLAQVVTELDKVRHDCLSRNA